MNQSRSLGRYLRDVPKDVEKIIGVGPSFPLDTSGGSTATNGGLERINQSIFIILSTPLGEVWFNPNFGSRLHQYVFQPYTEALKVQLAAEIRRALSENEPRIRVLDIQFDDSARDQNTVLVRIKYMVVGTAVVNDYVYPFKLEPAGPYE